MGLVQAVKNILKYILPPPVRTFLREITGLRQLIVEQSGGLTARQRQQEEQIKHQLAQLLHQEEMMRDLLTQQLRQEEVTRGLLTQQLRQEEVTKALSEQLERQQKAVEELAQRLERIAAVQKEISVGQTGIETTLKHAGEQQRKLSESVEWVRRQSTEGVRSASEAVWAEIFNNTISESTWLKNKAFAPGRWAVGYPYLYVMYRVLNEARPKRILELGLGQSTRMIAQYAAGYEDVEHIVVEHDLEWIRFFQNDFELSGHSKIVRLDREMVPYKEAEAVRVFQGFQEMFGGQKFDFISIDAPLGGDMKQYARIDVLGLLPECLEKNFVIMLDDCERSGETHTLAEMENRLAENGIRFKRGRYSGKKDCVLISAEHMGFLTSL